MAITVFEGCMIVSGAASGNIVLDEVAGQSWAAHTNSIHVSLSMTYL